MNIETKFDFFELVELKIDREKKPRMVVGVSMRPPGLSYALSTCESETWHYKEEIEAIKPPQTIHGFKEKQAP